jgi:hypothetical protein
MYTSHGHHIKGTILGDETPPQVARCGGPGLCRQCSTEAQIAQIETHDEDTILRVKLALVSSGLSQHQAFDAISAMQNAGILFRERI